MKIDPIANIGRRVRELIKEGDGYWRSCSGCHETEDGHPVGHYDHSPALGCDLGGGCSECGGIGATWDSVDYEGYAEFSREQDEKRDAVRILRRRLAWLQTTFAHDLPAHPGYSDSDGSWDADQILEQARAQLDEDWP